MDAESAALTTKVASAPTEPPAAELPAEAQAPAAPTRSTDATKRPARPEVVTRRFDPAARKAT
jgi:hypothetical protein